MSARDTALSTLIACRRAGAWSDGALKQNLARDGLDRRDAALATRLCFGVLQNRMLIDFWLSRFVRGSLEKLQPVVLDILRLAVCQLAFADKIPPSAAVSEAVNQTRRCANARAAGLVNGVLRSMLRSEDAFALPEDLSVRYSHPQALVDLLRDCVGPEKLEPLLAAHNGNPPTYLQINPLRADARTVAASLEAEGFTVTPHPWLENCLTLTGGSPERSAAFRDGLFYVQDPAARMAVLAADPQPGMEVLDCCAAPGGKSFAAGIQMQNRGVVCSCDLHAHKIDLIARGAARLGLDCIRASRADATVLDPDRIGRFDLVIADVPCSGLGVIRKKPDIRYKALDRLAELPAVQARILETQADCVRPGGVLLYATCTILKRENEDRVSAFLAARPDFTAEPFTLPGGLSAPAGTFTFLPCDHGTDGFFVAKLRRQS